MLIEVRGREGGNPRPAPFHGVCLAADTQWNSPTPSEIQARQARFVATRLGICGATAQAIADLAFERRAPR
jgi:hypothetical protein